MMIRDDIRELIEHYGIDMGDHVMIAKLDNLANELYDAHRVALEQERNKYRARVEEWRQRARFNIEYGGDDAEGTASAYESCADELSALIEVNSEPPHSGHTENCDCGRG